MWAPAPLILGVFLSTLAVSVFISILPAVLGGLHAHRLKTQGGYTTGRWVKMQDDAFEIRHVSFVYWRFRTPSDASVQMSSRHMHKQFRVGAVSPPLVLMEPSIEIQKSEDFETASQLVREVLSGDSKIVLAENLPITITENLTGPLIIRARALTKPIHIERVNANLIATLRDMLRNHDIETPDAATRTLH